MHNDEQHSHFYPSYYKINILRKARDKMGWVLKVFQSREFDLSHTNTLEVS